jgi:RNA polymerase sigma-70 factor, ECF subfamily
MNTQVLDSRSSIHSAREFERLMNETYRRAYHMAFQLTGNASEAEDLVQETYVKAWKGFHSYETGRSFLNWILRILQRANLDMRRRDNPIRKAEPLSLIVSPNDGDVQDIDVVDSSARADELVLRSEVRAELLSALAELPAVYGEALVLCDLEDFTYQQIAESQNTTVGTVRSRIHRGRTLLREVLKNRQVA